MESESAKTAANGSSAIVGRSEAVDEILAQLEGVIAGQRNVLELALATLLSGGHVLLEDRPGVGKTILAKALGRVLGLPTGRIQGTADLLPSDVSGVQVFQPNSAEWEFRPGPVFTSLLLFDELNRATPKAQASLLEAMAEQHVTVDGDTHPLPDPFMVIATQNPLGEIGTHPLGSAQIDRFATMLHLGLPGREAERAVLVGEAGAARLDQLSVAISREGLSELISNVKAVFADESIVSYILDCVDAVRALDPQVWLSVRVGEVLLNTARGHALINGRDYVAPEDVQNVALAVLMHRVPRGIEPAGVEATVRGVPAPVGV